MKRFWRRGLSLFLALVLTLGLLPTSALAGLVDNSRSQNERILEQLEALWGDEATAEEALALLKQYGLVDGDGNVITDWSGELYLEEDPRPLTLAEAAAARSGAVTVNGRAAQAREVAEALSQLEELGLFDGAALTADWQLAVDGAPTAPADYAAALTQAQADPAQEETPAEAEKPAEEGNPAQAETPAQEEPAEEEGGVLATLARALGLDGGEEPAEPAVTVDGAPADADALLDVIAFLDRYDLLTERGARTDWARTVPGEARQVTQAELKELLEAGTLDEDAVVTVGGQSITAGDRLVVLDIEAELRRIQETYFPEGGVDLSVEEAEALYSLYSQLLANGGFTLYNTNAADDLTADDFHSGIDQTVTISASGVDNAQMNSAYTVTVTLNEAQPKEDVIFSWRTFSGSVNAGGSGTVIIPAGQTEATFTASVGGAADRLDDGGQGAFVVQVYDVKNAPCSPTGRTAGPRPSGSRARMR